MDFAEAERRFATLDAAHRQGSLNLAGYRAELARLRVTDSAGRTWQIQETSGQWHVYNQGQWIAAAPPGRAARANARPTAPLAARPGVRLAAGLAAGAVIGLFILGAAAILVTGRGTPERTITAGAPPTAVAAGVGTPRPSVVQATPSPAPATGTATITFKRITAATVAADGKAVTDASGISLLVPGGVLSPTISAELESAAGSGTLLQTLEGKYVLETPFYRAYAKGANDSKGRATLRFPARGPQSVLLTVADGVYVVALTAKPENGFFERSVRLGPEPGADLSALGPNGSAHDLRYVVATPKSTGLQTPNDSTGSAAHGLAAPPNQVDLGWVCTGSDKWTLNSYCRSDDFHVNVIWPSSLNSQFNVQSGYALATAIRNAFKKYSELKFSAAEMKVPFSWPTPIYVVASGAPTYYPSSGSIYIPVDVAKNVAAGANDYALLHELAHWIQDEEYLMIPGYWNSPRRWWLEVAAENMVMLYDKSYAQFHIEKYGRISEGDGSLVLQHSPNQWFNEEGYVQAHLVRVNMCDTGNCPISQKSFVEAINQGTYPLNDFGAQLLMDTNMDDYARYLLGVPPLLANKAATIIVSTADLGFSQRVRVEKSTKGDFVIDVYGEAPQIRKEGDGVLLDASIIAPLERDGAYPLMIVSGPDDKSATYPLELRIEKGVEVWYRLDGGDAMHHGGKSELVLGPIHRTMGYRAVQIVAIAETKLVFRARLQMVDLKGAWILSSGKVLKSNLTCSPTKPGDSQLVTPQEAALIYGLGLATGRFDGGANRQKLNWARVADNLQSNQQVGEFTMPGTVEVGLQNVVLRARLDAPKKTGSLPQNGVAVPLAAGVVVGVVPVAWLGRRAPRRRLMALGLVVFALALSGCGNLYGTIAGDFTFTKMEYVGGQDEGTWEPGKLPTKLPLWQLTGTGTYVVRADQALSAQAVGQPQSCAGTVEAEVVASVYKSALVIVK